MGVEGGARREVGAAAAPATALEEGGATTGDEPKELLLGPFAPRLFPHSCRITHRRHRPKQKPLGLLSLCMVL